MDLALAGQTEEASLRAWPAREREQLDGWELRASSGFTKRANSVQPFGPSTRPVSEIVSDCEKWYAARGLPTIFRLTPFADPSLDAFLAERAYQLVEPTDVLVTRLPISERPSSGLELMELELGEWLQVYGTLSDKDEASLFCLRAILEACGQRRRFGALAAGSQEDSVACGLAVVDGDLVGLFDLVTAEPYRRRGHGAALVAGLLEWGLAQGTQWAYLQVVRTKHPAKALYEKLGFEKAYEYWYRVQAKRV